MRGRAVNADEIGTVRRRLEAMAVRAQNNAAYELDTCARVIGGLNLASTDAAIPLADAEKLATAATALTRYLSALEAYQVSLALLEDS